LIVSAIFNPQKLHEPRLGASEQVLHGVCANIPGLARAIAIARGLDPVDGRAQKSPLTSTDDH
jgi:hypothetical protein